MKKFRPFAFFDRTFFFLLGLASVSGAVCYVWLGPEVFFASFRSDAVIFLDIAPKMAVALLIAAYIQLLVSRDIVARYLGEKSGLKGIALATALGTSTPGGPMTSFPVVRSLYDAGTGRAALVAYLASWSTLGFNRVLIWDAPLFGMDVTAIRYLASLPLPFIAAFISSLLPARKPQE